MEYRNIAILCVERNLKKFLTIFEMTVGREDKGALHVQRTELLFPTYERHSR